jgi:hypothetical protein
MRRGDKPDTGKLSRFPKSELLRRNAPAMPHDMPGGAYGFIYLN